MIVLKNVSIQDIPIIQSLANKIWNEHYTSIIGEAQIKYMLGLFYNEKSLSEQMSYGQVFYLIEKEGLVGGFLSITAKNEEEFFIHKFYIDLRGKGMGKKVFEMLFTLFPKTKIVRLNVNKHNFKSINFYFKLGFQIENMAVFEIGNGYVMDDFMMVWNEK
jgi:diamine N-acetyltransferase